MRDGFSRIFWREMMLFHIIPALIIFLLFEGAFFFVAIPSARASLMNAQRMKVKDLTQLAWTILEQWHQLEEEGGVERSRAMEQARDRLGSLRYGDGLKDYFWITDMDYRMVMHPYRPELEGVDLRDFKDPEGNYLFRGFRDLVAERGEGFSEYLWQLNDNTNRVISKVSYVKGFAPWGWIVGTGIYLDEVEGEIDRIISNVRHAFIGITLVLIMIGAYVLYRAYHSEIEKLEALQRVRAGESKFRAIYDDSIQFIGLLDLDGRLIDANKTSLSLIDQPLEELLGKPFWDLPWWQGAADGCRQLKRGIERCVAGEETRFETTHIDHQGRMLHVDFSLKPIFDAAGNVVQIIPEGRDITDRKMFEAQLAQKNVELSAARGELMAAIENSPVGIIIADAPLEGADTPRLRSANRAAFAIRGTTPRELAPDELDSYFAEWPFFHADGTECPPSEAPLPRAVMEGAKIENAEYLAERTDGERRRLLANAAPIRDSQGAITAGILIFLDVTEEQALRERLAHAEKLDSIGQLAGGVAHDFNNMLTGILGAAELLEFELGDDPKLGPLIDMIKNSSTRAADLTQQLLAFSRKNPSVMAPVNLHDLVGQTVEILKRSINKNVRIETQLEAAAPVVNGDGSMLQNAILNLCLNARDAMPAGGTLAIRTREVERAAEPGDDSGLPAGRFLQLDIADTGEGIAPGILSHIFEPFFTTKEVGKGSGLGLAAVYGAVSNHSGSIVAENMPGGGARFRLLLPAPRERSADAQNARPSSPMVKGSGLVLVVDDEEIIRKSTLAQLRALGYETLTAADGADGLRIYEENSDRIDLVVLDVVMPKMGGAECARAILKRDPAARVLLWSGHIRDEGIDCLLMKPNCAFVRKPCRLTELSAAVARLLERDLGRGEPGAD